MYWLIFRVTHYLHVLFMSFRYFSDVEHAVFRKRGLLSPASPKRARKKCSLPPSCSCKGHGVYPRRVLFTPRNGGQWTNIPEGQYVSTTRIRSLKMKSSFLAPNAEMVFVYGVHLFWILSMRDEKILHVCKNTRGKMGDWQGYVRSNCQSHVVSLEMHWQIVCTMHKRPLQNAL